MDATLSSFFVLRITIGASFAVVLAFVTTARAQPAPSAPAIDLRVARPSPAEPPVVVLPATSQRAPAAPQVEWALSSLMSSAVLAGTSLPDNDQAPRWAGGIAFDDSVRSALALDDERAQNVVATASDIGLFAIVLTPVIVDAMLLAWLVEDDPVLMGEMLLVNLQAHAVAQGLTALFKHAAARERPMSRACRENGDCEGPEAPESFFSGHASLAFTSAALVCHYHSERELLGGGGDAAMCATGMALASGVGVMRILADRHYATDVLIGAAVGLLSGFLVPRFLNFGRLLSGGRHQGVSAAVGPMIGGDQYGVQVFGMF